MAKGVKRKNPNFFIPVVIAIVLMIVFTLAYLFLKNQRITKTTSPVSKTLAFNFIKSKFITPTPLPTVTPAPTLSPTPTATPTPTPLPGYCLHVPILMYHHIQPSSVAQEKGQSGLSVDNGVFEQHMAYLNEKGYTTMSVLQLINALATKSGLPGKPIVVTLDDGYRDVFTYAYPILQRYHIVANLAIPAGLMEGADYLTWSQIREMSGSGLVYYMNHTWSHYSLGKGDLTKVKFEIETATQLLEQHTGQKINIFVYPYGSESPMAIKVLQEDGFIGALSTIPGVYQCDAFILSLHRSRIGNSPLSYYGF